jgi:hypothetical protein
MVANAANGDAEHYGTGQTNKKTLEDNQVIAQLTTPAGQPARGADTVRGRTVELVNGLAWFLRSACGNALAECKFVQPSLLIT